MKNKIAKIIMIAILFYAINLDCFTAYALDTVPLDDALKDLDMTISTGVVPEIARDKYKQDVSKANFLNMLIHSMLTQLDCKESFDHLSEADKKLIYKNINYIDLNSTAQSADYVALSHYLGISKNVSPKRFGMDDIVTRQEAAQIVFVYYNLFPEIKKSVKSGKLDLTKLGSSRKKVDVIIKNFDLHFYNDLIYGLDDKETVDSTEITREQVLLLLKRFYIYTSADSKFLKTASSNRLSHDADNILLMYKFRNNMLIDSKSGKSKDDVIMDKNVRKLLDLINEERVRAGRPKIKYSYDLDSYANIRAKELVKDFSHIRPDGTEFYSGTPYKSGVAEDIAAGYSNAENLFKSWKENPEYIKSITKPEYDKVAFGYFRDESNKHKYYWVQLLFDEYHNNGLLNNPKVKDQKEYIKTSKEEVLNMVNVERQKNGLNALVEFTEIGDYSDLRAMELTQRFSHTRPDGSSFESGMPYKFGVGENIAGGQTSATQAMREWMNSPGHRENILRPEYDKMSVGLVIVPNTQYTYYWVQTFYAQD